MSVPTATASLAMTAIALFFDRARFSIVLDTNRYFFGGPRLLHSHAFAPRADIRSNKARGRQINRAMTPVAWFAAAGKARLAR